MSAPAAEAIADATGEPSRERILPPPFDRSVAVAVAERVAQAARRRRLSRRVGRR